MPLDDLSRQREQIVDAVQRCFLVPMLWLQMLRGDSRKHFNVKFPSGGLVRLFRLPLHFEELEVDLQGGHVPILKPLFPFHAFLSVCERRACQCATLQTLQTALYFIISCSFVMRCAREVRAS